MCRILSTIILLTTLFYSAIAQEGSIKVIAHYSNNTLCLRWGVKGHETYDGIRNHGLKIERYTIISGNDTLTSQQRNESRYVLQEAYKPQSETWINENLPDNDFSKLLRDALYSTTGDSEINLDNPRLVDAVNRDKQNQAKLFGIQFAAEQDFNIAKAAALGIVDETAQSNHVYIYSISLFNNVLGKNIVEPCDLSVSTFANNEFALINTLSAKGLPLAIELKWLKTPETMYSGYDIYRSVDDNEYVKINEKPFVYFKSSGIASNEVTYIDSVAPGNEFYYKVVGRTSFGTTTELSSSVVAQSLHPSLANLVISLDKPIPTMTDVTLNWTMDATFEDKIHGFNIYRSEHYDGTYTKLNTNFLLPKVRNFTDLAPNTVSYYYVEAKDLHEYVYVATPVIVYLPDSIPPAAPTGLTAKYYGSTKVELNWASNAEDDLAGYRVEVSNHRNGMFVQKTSTYITSNQYEYFSDPTVVSDSIFFRIFAQDKRGNYSDMSNIYGCKRPDLVPPAAPGFNTAIPSREGIQLKWTYSPTPTVVSHKLERKPEGKPSWETVLVITNEQKPQYMPTDSTDYNYLDTFDFEARPYQYRFIALEPNNITATSGMLTVTPIPETVSKSVIKDFKIEEEVVTAPASRLVQEQINNLKKNRPNARFSAAENEQHNIKLSFTYNLDPNLKEFLIMRSITGGNLSLYRTVSIEEAMGLDPNTQQVMVQSDQGPKEFVISDKELITGRRYAYQVMAKHKDGSTTKRSSTLTKKI